MRKFAFLSRHVPTTQQRQMAEGVGIELVKIPDLDAFTVDPALINEQEGGPFDGVVVVHPAAAMRLCHDFPIGVFENKNRAPLGEPPRFEAAGFSIFDV